MIEITVKAGCLSNRRLPWRMPVISVSMIKEFGSCVRSALPVRTSRIRRSKGHATARIRNWVIAAGFVI